MKIFKWQNMVLTTAVSFLLVVSSYMPSTVVAKELKIASFMSAKHPVNRGILPHFAKNIANETGGSLKLKLYPSGQLGKGPKAQY